LTYVKTKQGDHQSDVSKHGFLSVGWFVLLVVAGGLVGYLQDMVLGKMLPVEVVWRVLLLFQILFILAFCRIKTQPLPGILTLPILLLSISMFITLILRLVDGDDVRMTLRAFYFMFGIGIFIIFMPFVPLVIERMRFFAAFAVVTILFATFQVLSQEMHFSDSLRTEFGLQFDLFTNGRLRAVGFFASAPRFAEFLVFILSWLLFDMISKGRFALLKLVMYGLCIWLLFNTYSRSGYVLFVGTTAMIILMKQRQIFGARGVWGLLARVIGLFGFAGLMIALVAFVDFGSLEVTNLTSFLARLQHWVILQERISNLTVLQYLFGSGNAAMYSRSELDYFVVDNLFLVLFLYSGFLGLLAFLLLFISTIMVALTEIRRHQEARILPVVALYVGLAFQGLFVDNHNTFFLTQLGIIAMIRANRIATRDARPMRGQ
jgi:hypothetical protein